MLNNDFEEELMDVEDAPEGDGPEGGEPATKAKDEVAETLKELRGEMKSLRSRLGEAEEDARFWRTQAKGGSKEETPEPEEDEEEISVSDDLLEAFSSGDPKRVAKVMREMGFTRKRDVELAIGQTRQEISEQSKLYQQYPDLQDPESEFFQETAKIYNDLAKDKTLAKSGKTIEIAARMAAAEMGMTAKASKRSRDVEDDDEEEFERRTRVSAQSGDRGRRPSRSARTDDDSDLNTAQRTIIAKFAAAGSTVTEEGYRKRAAAGIKMSGLPSRRGKR